MPSNMFINKSKRLTLDKIGQLEEDLEIEPLNYVKWNKLIEQVIAKDNQEQVRAVYTKYLNIFKFDGSNWCKYIKYELNRGEKQKVETLFQQCFAITDSVELCRLYVDYVRSATDFITGGEQARGTLIQAFEFAVNKVGIDINSDGLWNDYINFLKSWQPNANWEQQQKTDLIRKVYKKYLVIPTENIETAWSSYTKWENELNPATAQKFISEKSSEFMLARSWHTEWNNLTEKKLKRNISPYSITGDEHELIECQLGLWLKWIELEKKNTLEIKDESLLEKRISFVYKQATYALPFVPQLWFTYSKYLLYNNEEANIGTCVTLLKDGVSFNPKSMLLSFQLAELYEKDNSFDNARETFNNLISALTNEFTRIKSQIVELNEKINQKPEDGKDEEVNRDSTEQKIVPISIADSRRLVKLQEIQSRLSNSITLAYIKLMIASKRARDIKEARNVFKIARKFESIGYEIFVESALLEHYTGNPKTALKIFDLGKKFFATNGEFLLAYLDYLIMINDPEAMRSTLQTSDTSISKEITSITESLTLENLDPITKSQKEKELRIKKEYLRKLFKKYISFAADYLQMDVINSFVKKYEQLLPGDDPIDLFTDRYKLGQQNIIKRTEIGGDYESEEEEPRSKRRKVSKKITEEVSSVVQNIQASSNQVEQEQQKQPDSFVGPSIVALMGALPNASYFGLPSESVFDSEKLVTLFANLSNIP